MKKNKSRERKALYFNLDNKDQYIASTFFSKCGRKQSKYISMIISYFLKQYGLEIETISKEELSKFFEALPIIEKMNDNISYSSAHTYRKNEQEGNKNTLNSQQQNAKILKEKREIIKKKMTF